MGIGTTVKNILSSDHTDDDQRRMSRTRSKSNEASSLDSRGRLPAGTGAGTTGKPSELALEQEVERVERNRASQGIAGYGTDAAAAAGGSLGGTHMGTIPTHESPTKGQSGTGTALGAGLASTSGTGSLKRESAAPGTYEQGQTMPFTTSGTGITETRREPGELGAGRMSTLESGHTFGHGAMDTMPDNQADQDTNRLERVVHEQVRHIETEEVARVKEHERHIHHIQHHVQPLTASEELPVEHRNVTHPVTRITETHAAKSDAHNLFQDQVQQHHDTLTHAPKERMVIDKGIVVNEHIHHHIHHVVQPVIMKETIDRQHIHTTIPIHEVTHEAPVVHQPKLHPPLPLEEHLHGGGSISAGVPHAEIREKMLGHEQCQRHVEGIAEQLEKDLNLGHSAVHPDLVGTTDELAAKKMAAPPDRGAMAPAEMPMPAPSKN